MPSASAPDTGGHASLMTAHAWLTARPDALLACLQETRGGAVYRGGLTPLHLVAHRGSSVLVGAVVAAGLAPDSCDDYGRTALMLAAAHTRDERASALVQTLIGLGARVSAADHFGSQALHYAARVGNAVAFHVLLSTGAAPDAPNLAGETPRSVAEETRRSRASAAGAQI